MSFEQFSKLFLKRGPWRAARQFATALLTGWLALFDSTQAASPEVSVMIGAGLDNIPGVNFGELLLSELNCAACHAPTAPSKIRLASREAPRLGADGISLTSQYLGAFLFDPHATKPGTMHPDLFQSADTVARAVTVDALLHFLMSIQRPDTNSPVGADSFKIARGRQLYHQIGCVACHAPQEPAAALAAASGSPAPSDPAWTGIPRESVPLGNLSRKMTVAELAKFLMNPQQARPSGRMPSLNLSETEAIALAMYLLREQASSGEANVPSPRLRGLSFQYFEGAFSRTSAVEASPVNDTGLVDHFNMTPRKRPENVGLRFTGFVSVPADGAYTFFTSSDDGSRLYLGNTLVVDNDGDHATTERSGRIDLKVGEHPIMVVWFNRGGEASLRVSWQGPGLPKQEIPASALTTDQGKSMVPPGAERFVLDPQKTAQGKSLFASMGCAACHQTGPDPVTSSLPAPPLDRLNVNAVGGCIDATVRKGAARYPFTRAQRAALRAALGRPAELSRPLTPPQTVTHTMARLNCYACHARDGVGGPHSESAAYFRVVGNEDLGDEGRLPPHLTRVGDKLRPEWLAEVLLKKGAVRPYMATRMPQFGEAAVRPLMEAFQQADNSGRSEPRTDLALANWGRKLVGTGGLSCISCHGYAGYKSLGIPAMDLAHMTKRLRKDWFHRYLLDPASLRPGTRMPSFWPEGKSARADILEGNTDRQIEAIWASLARGSEGGLPPGLVQGKMELAATNEPIIYRNFIEGAGARAIGVGYPEKANLAFDADQLRLAMIWQGPFIDAAIHRIGRGEGFAKPLGYNIVNLPPGAPLARLPNADAPWPPDVGKKAGFQMRGYSLDKDLRPTFLYSFNDIQVEEHWIPVPGDVDAYFRRTMRLKAPAAVEQLWFRAWAGKQLERKGNNSFLVEGNVMLRFTLPAESQPVIRQSNDRMELLVPIPLRGGAMEFIEEINW